jgi:23S rRNA pseudouridine1911/1915/1917 synthase
VAGVQRRRQRDLDRGGAAGPLPALQIDATARRLTADRSYERLDRFLAEHAPELSRSAAARLLREGHATLNGHAARPADRVAAGDVVEFQPPSPTSLRPAPEQIPLEVLYEDDDFLVVVKPAGMVVHPAPGHGTGTLVHALLGRGGRWSTAGGEARPGIVHRLDRGTSGLMLAARSDAAHRNLSGQLAARTLSRTYLAIVRGRPRPEQGVVEGAIGRHPRDRKRMAVVERGREARTRYRLVESRGGYSLLELELDTGRTHQIRVHLAALGHPVAGDETYAGRRAGEPDRPMLHATRLRLRHPATGERLEFEAPPPADFAAFWESLS